MTDKPQRMKRIRFIVPGPPVGLEHEENRKGGGRRTATKSRKYMEHAGWHAMKAACDNQIKQGGYTGDTYLDLEIFYAREWPRPDPLNVADALQDGFTPVLWPNDRNVLARVQSTWWPGKDDKPPPPALVVGGRYTGGVCCTVIPKGMK